MDRSSLKNNANLWISNNEWNFKTKDELIYVENLLNNTVLGTTIDGTVIEEELVKDKPGQLWKRGKSNTGGYFVLENVDTNKVMTAISSSCLKIKGNFDYNYE